MANLKKTKLKQPKKVESKKVEAKECWMEWQAPSLFHYLLHLKDPSVETWTVFMSDKTKKIVNREEHLERVQKVYEEKNALIPKEERWWENKPKGGTAA